MTVHILLKQLWVNGNGIFNMMQVQYVALGYAHAAAYLTFFLVLGAYHLKLSTKHR
jgi:hypothetical protein